MKGSQFDFHDLVLIPLTPVHIGGGDEAVLGLEDYRLKQNALEFVDIRNFILAAPDRQRILRSLSHSVVGSLAKIQDRIPDDHVKERIPISEIVRKELELVFRQPAGRQSRRQGIVYGFQRSGGKPILPGSSLKGCLRTAWLAECLKRHASSSNSNSIGGMSKPDNETLIKVGFGLNSTGDTDKDPFRDVSVADAVLPDGSTRVDMVSSWKFDRDKEAFGLSSSGQYQLMRERLRAVVDGGEAPVIPVRLGLRSNPVWNERKAKGNPEAQPQRAPSSISVLLSALESHHVPLWKRELDRFFPQSGDRLEQAIELFKDFSRMGLNPDAALLRIGWASHAESKSIAKFRRIQVSKFRGKDAEFLKEGTTRHVVDLPGGAVPFGWALLVKADVWKTNEIDAWLPIARLQDQQASHGKKASPKTKLRFRKGDRVRLESDEFGTLIEDLNENQEFVQIDIDGDIEPVKRTEIIGPA